MRVIPRSRGITTHPYQPSIPGSGRGSDGTTAADVYVSVKHEAYTELQLVDAIVYKLRKF